MSSMCIPRIHFINFKICILYKSNLAPKFRFMSFGYLKIFQWRHFHFIQLNSISRHFIVVHYTNSKYAMYIFHQFQSPNFVQIEFDVQVWFHEFWIFFFENKSVAVSILAIFSFYRIQVQCTHFTVVQCVHFVQVKFESTRISSATWK